MMAINEFIEYLENIVTKIPEKERVILDMMQTARVGARILPWMFRIQAPKLILEDQNRQDELIKRACVMTIQFPQIHKENHPSMFMKFSVKKCAFEKNAIIIKGVWQWCDYQLHDKSCPANELCTCSFAAARYQFDDMNWLC
jgi:hypothetical protein